MKLRQDILLKYSNELVFLQGIVDFGFENLGTKENEQATVAFWRNGVKIPNTNWKLRRNQIGSAVLEAADGTEQYVLPDFWKQAIYVTDENNIFTWIGKKCQFKPKDFNFYKDVGGVDTKMKTYNVNLNQKILICITKKGSDIKNCYCLSQFCLIY